jgi:hypothetical protein
MATPVRRSLRSEIRDEPASEGPRLTRQRVGTIDRFHIPEHLMKPGWSYEWKRKTTYGMPDTAYDMSLLMNHWKPVQATDMPGLMPEGYSGAVERDGMILMSRPSYLTEEARLEDRYLAMGQIQDKKAALGQVGPNEFERDLHEIKRQFAPAPDIPND